MRLRPSLTNLTLAALVAGILFGAAAPSWAGHLGILSKLFVRLLQMLVAPLVFSTLAAGIGGSARNVPLKRLAIGAIAYFAAATLVASLIGLVAGNALLPFIHIAAPAGAAASPVAAAAPESFAEMLIPSSIVRAMADNNLLAVVFFTVLLAVALRTLRNEESAPLVRLLDSVAAAMVRLAGGLMWTAPVAVFAAAASVVATSAWASLRSFGALLVAGYASLAAFALLMLVASSALGRFRARAFVRAVAGALLLAFSTASSAAALPGAMEELERWGASRRTISFVLPLGYSFNLTGPALYLPLVTLFWARMNGVTLGWGEQLVLLALVFALVRGIPPIPRGLFLVWGGLLAQLHLPPEGLVIMLAIDPLLDMARTFVNVEGNCLAVATLDSLDRRHPAPA